MGVYRCTGALPASGSLCVCVCVYLGILQVFVGVCVRVSFCVCAYAGVQVFYRYYVGVYRYTEALPYFNHAWLHNCSMHRSQGIACMAGLDNRLIAFFRRNCLRVRVQHLWCSHEHNVNLYELKQMTAAMNDGVF